MCMERQNFETKRLYSPVMATITDVEKLTESERRFRIELPNREILGHQPGQFVQVSMFGYGEAPISICSSPTNGPEFELTVRKVGRLTEHLHRMQVGSQLGIRGPFGHGFNVSDFEGKDILFVCGGIGLAPLKSLIDYTIARREHYGRIIILYGTKSPAEILFKSEIEKWRNDSEIEFHMTVDRPDQNWNGHCGVITTLIPPLELDTANTIAAVVGPPVMYKFVLMSLKARRIPDDNIFLSLERRMKCGVGKCGHCQINSVYVCQHGPVFPYPLAKRLEEAI